MVWSGNSLFQDPTNLFGAQGGSVAVVWIGLYWNGQCSKYFRRCKAETSTCVWHRQCIICISFNRKGGEWKNGFVSGNCDLIRVSDIHRKRGSFMSGVNVKGMFYRDSWEDVEDCS